MPFASVIMWLLNTTTLKLEDFMGSIPPYAILSHTWGDEEVSFQAITTGVTEYHTKGYEKIKRSCALARSDGHEYIWIDTCCIDKKSSAELSEAINSMYAWYSKAVICYVFMCDVAYGVYALNKEQDFVKSRWFTRGWTLQELLAPRKIKFYDRNWDYIGDRRDMLNLVSQATGIEPLYISHGRPIREASVAARMAWASKRETTRQEDKAYCLMGIFNVNMPLLYGEGDKAFLRLQHEIVEDSHDESLFAWHSRATHSGIFASDTFAFSGCEDVETLYNSRDIDQYSNVREAPTITNRGLRIEMRCEEIPFTLINGHDAALGNEARLSKYFIVVLCCAHRARMDRPIAILVRQISGNLFMRFLPSEIMVFEKYYPDTVFNRMKHRMQETRIIHIQDPLKLDLNQFAWSSPYTHIVEPSKAVLSEYRLENIHISPPGVFQSEKGFDDRWSIHFAGWSGIAMVKLKDPNNHSLIITIKNVHSNGAGRCLSLEPVLCNEHNFMLKDACYAKRDMLQPINHPTRSSLCGHGVEVHLEGRTPRVAREHFTRINTLKIRTGSLMNARPVSLGTRAES